MPISGKLQTKRAIREAKAFSLVEVVLALGILSVAVIPLFGLLPIGMNRFKEAIDTTTQSQIMEKLTTLAEQTEFSKIDSIATSAPSVDGRDGVTPHFYYFDDQGTELSGTASRLKSVYTANVTYLAQTIIPNGSAVGVASKSMATLWVDIYNNRGVFDANGKPVDAWRRTFILHIADYGKRI